MDKLISGGPRGADTPPALRAIPRVFAPFHAPVWSVSPTGALSFVQAKPVNNERHNDASGYRQQELLFAVGTALSGSPPHRSLQAEFPHKAPLMRIWRKSAFQDRDAVELVGESSVPQGF